MLRRMKFVYALYNFFHRKQLAHNIPIYKKLGLKKSYYSPVSSKDFKHLTASDTTGDEHLSTMSETLEKQLGDFDQNGYLILPGYLTKEIVAKINVEIENLLATQKIKFGYGNKLMFAIHHSKILRSIGTDPELMKLISVLLRGPAALFQSINFIMGSEQHTHSDSIHMTTYPLGGLLGVWIALEDIDEDNGPLHYYPGSHKLPYYLNADYDNEGSYFLLGKKNYTEYEKMIDEKVAEKNIEK